MLLKGMCECRSFGKLVKLFRPNLESGVAKLEATSRASKRIYMLYKLNNYA